VQRKHAGGRINIGLIMDLYRQIKRADPDVVHLSGLQASGFHAACAARLARKKVLMAVRGFSGDACNISTLKKLMFSHIIEPCTLRMADRFYTVCGEAAGRKMIRRAKRKFAGVIYNAAPDIAGEAEATEARRKYRELLGLGKGDVAVVVSGRMIYDKGIQFIADAIDMPGPGNLKFIFAGDGEYCEILRNRFGPYIRDGKMLVLGKRDDVREILLASDIFLFATLHENLSNALLEAMAAGLPVIATNVGGNPDVVRDGALVHATEEEISRAHRIQAQRFAA
jgi:glycosyltransferase involved in cell wall biosynthesis